MNKKFKWSALAIVAMLASCSQEAPLSNGSNSGEEIITSIGIKAPTGFGTRAVPNVFNNSELEWAGESGYPSIGNVDLKDHPLSFTVGVYVGKEVGGETVYTLVEQQSKTQVANDEAYFNFRLLKDQTYKLVAYADFASEAKENLEEISYQTNLNNELDDAFFVSLDFQAKEHVAAVLKRPFGKLRLIARDFNVFSAGEKYNITKVKVSYKGQPMLSTDTFNALTGEFNYEATAKGDIDTENAAASYALEYDENGKAEYATIFTHYLPANFGVEDTTGDYTAVNEENPVPQSWMYPFDIEVTYKDEKNNETTLTRSYQFDIPVKRNWLTTLDVADFMTENTNVKLSVDHRFEGFITEKLPIIETVNNEDELVVAIDKIVHSASHTGKIIIGQNIIIDHHYDIELYGYGNDLYVTIDLNGYTISQETPESRDDEGNRLYSDAVFFIYGGGPRNVLTIEDSSLEGTGAILSIDKETCKDCTTIFVQFGGEVVINGGTIKCCNDNAAVYTFDTKAFQQTYGFPDSYITINGGWIENIDGATYVGQYGMKYLADTLVNIYNNDNIGIVHLNGGSYVDFNPLNGDNICGNTTNAWVDDDHEVISETIDGHTVYTVIAKENPSYY